jgi:DNA-binding protein H-NS
MIPGPPDPTPWLLQWVTGAVFALLTTVIGFLWHQIGASKKEAIEVAEQVRKDLVEATRMQREEMSVRHAENQLKFDRIEEEIAARGIASQTQHNRLDDKLSKVLELIAEKPSRDDVRADMAALKTDIAALVGRGRA